MQRLSGHLYIEEQLSDDEDDVSENGKKNTTFRLAKQQLCKSITLFCTFVCRHCTTTTWKCLISRFVLGTWTQGNDFRFLFLNFDTPVEFNSRKICQHLTNWTRWNKRYKIWNRANWLFKWRFRSRRRQRRGPGTNYGIRAISKLRHVWFHVVTKAFSYIVSSKVHKANIEIR